MTQAFESIIVEPPRPATACVIWLHGLGATGHDFVDAVEALELPSKHSVRFIFPHAPNQAVTINNNMTMPAWFDIHGLDINAIQDEKGITAAQATLGLLIKDVIQQGIPSDRIILIGFSQGGALALHTAIRFDQPLAGVAGLSTYIPLHRQLAKEQNPANKNISIFLAHGFMDPVVSYWIGQQTLAFLEGAGYEPQWNTYPMAHTVCLPELHALGQWIRGLLEI